MSVVQKERFVDDGYFLYWIAVKRGNEVASPATYTCTYLTYFVASTSISLCIRSILNKVVLLNISRCSYESESFWLSARTLNVASFEDVPHRFPDSYATRTNPLRAWYGAERKR